MIHTGVIAFSCALEGLAMKIEVKREADGRWIAEIPDLPGVMAYGDDENEAISRAKVLALLVLADRLERGEQVPELSDVFAISP